MSRKYVTIDTGKYATKVSVYDEKSKNVKKFSIKTASCEGDFRDDAIEECTAVVQSSILGDNVYKVGNGARGIGAELKTDKKLDIHKICVATALANVASEKEVDDIYVAILLPAKDWAVVSKREDFREFILPEGEITTKVKGHGFKAPVEKSFVVKKRYIFPESMGALFMDEVIGDVSPTSVIGVLDIGNLNLNATLWNGKDLVQDESTTADLGGSILIGELAQEISTNVTSCNEMLAAIILKNGRVPDDIKVSDEQRKEIDSITARVKKLHAEKIKRVCYARNWSLDLIKIIAIGGTSKDLEAELKETFGENLVVLPSTEYVNSLGALRMMCAKELSEIIPFNFAKK